MEETDSRETDATELSNQLGVGMKNRGEALRVSWANG